MSNDTPTPEEILPELKAKWDGFKEGYHEGFAVAVRLAAAYWPRGTDSLSFEAFERACNRALTPPQVQAKEGIAGMDWSLSEEARARRCAGEEGMTHWDGICEHGLLLDTYCKECDAPMTDLREAIARALATANEHNPDEPLKVLWRSPDARDDEVMRVWHEYVEEADAALAAIEAAGCGPKRIEELETGKVHAEQLIYEQHARIEELERALREVTELAQQIVYEDWGETNYSTNMISKVNAARAVLEKRS
jgi:hypothetical protein